MAPANGASPSSATDREYEKQHDNRKAGPTPGFFVAHNPDFNTMEVGKIKQVPLREVWKREDTDFTVWRSRSCSRNMATRPTWQYSPLTASSTKPRSSPRISSRDHLMPRCFLMAS